MLPSLWEAIAGTREVEWAVEREDGKQEFTPGMSRCWAWKDELADRKLVCVGKHLGRWQELAATISMEIDLSTDMAAVTELKFRRGAVQEQYLEDGAGAVASYREALEIDSSHVGARTAVAGLAILTSVVLIVTARSPRARATVLQFPARVREAALSRAA